ncbi:hypothetical protein [Ornithinimicrobium panacihumi]|uniref:hypothetical protein n=1 Tax=Ornithinimicrobium panacihumi TaxID=2008449 RepID=UPI003F8BA49A
MSELLDDLAAQGDHRWYAVSTHELTATLEEADRRLRMARSWLDEAGQGVAAMTTLGGVDQEIWHQAEGRGDARAVEAALSDLYRASLQVVSDVTEVQGELDRAKGALQASDVLLAGMPAPTDVQERVDQEALRDRVSQLHRAVGEARPFAVDIVDRMQDTGRLAAEGLHHVREGEPVSVENIGRQVSCAQGATRDLDGQVTSAAGTAHRAAGQAQMVAAQARLRMGQGMSTRHLAVSAPPLGIRR